MNQVKKMPVFYPEECDDCGNCIPICPGQAIFRTEIAYQNEVLKIGINDEK
jgi:NAD-dependent dihydropyrimidine dehydrogenase PreA subunit